MQWAEQACFPTHQLPTPQQTNPPQYLHHGVQYGFTRSRRIPTAYGLRELWETPSLSSTNFLDSTPTQYSNTTMVSLWWVFLFVQKIE